MDILGRGTLFVGYTTQMCKKYIPHTDSPYAQTPTSSLWYVLLKLFLGVKRGSVNSTCASMRA